MYLPTMDGRQRKDITEEFFHYRHLTQAKLWDRYSAYEHWAKIEVIISIIKNERSNMVFGYDVPIVIFLFFLFLLSKNNICINKVQHGINKPFRTKWD